MTITAKCECIYLMYWEVPVSSILMHWAAVKADDVLLEKLRKICKKPTWCWYSCNKLHKLHFYALLTHILVFFLPSSFWLSKSLTGFKQPLYYFTKNHVKFCGFFSIWPEQGIFLAWDLASFGCSMSSSVSMKAKNQVSNNTQSL